jgi:predicted RNA-binding Zn-ribbon protein involved in translation (DUF1610 family)
MRYSIETLVHFQCTYCEGWFSIGDAPLQGMSYYCPWCGKLGKMEGSNDANSV